MIDGSYFRAVSKQSVYLWKMAHPSREERMGSEEGKMSMVVCNENELHSPPLVQLFFVNHNQHFYLHLTLLSGRKLARLMMSLLCRAVAGASLSPCCGKLQD